MSRSRNSIIVASLMLASPLAAQWQDCYNIPYGTNIPFLDDCSNRFFAEVDYLLWYANQEGLSYASSIDLISYPVNSPNPFNGVSNDLYFDNKWNSGVRATLGFKPMNKSWDTRISYSYFQTKVHPKAHHGLATFDSVDSVASGVVILTDFIFNDFIFPNLNTPTTITANDARWKLSFNELDWDFSRDVFLSKDILFRPFIGIRGLLTYQSLEESFQLNNTIFGMLKAQTRFEGLGVHAGFDLSYNLFYGIELFGDFGGGVYWGRFKTIEHLAQNSSGTSLALIPTFSYLNHSHHDAVVNLDLGLGFKWNYWVKEGSNLLTLKFAWEQHLYTNMNQFRVLNTPLESGIEQNNVKTTAFGPSIATTRSDRNLQRGDLSLSGFIFGVDYTF